MLYQVTTRGYSDRGCLTDRRKIKNSLTCPNVDPVQTRPTTPGPSDRGNRTIHSKVNNVLT
jgi:hypothetical protein